MRIKKLKLRTFALVALTGLSIALSACGGDAATTSTGTAVSGSTSSSSGTTTTTTTSSAPPATSSTTSTASSGTGSTSTSGSTSTTGSAGGSTAAVELSGSPTTTVAASAAYSFEPTLKQGSGTVTFSITGKPNWATFSAATGLLSGTPGTANEGKSASITISASNGNTSASLAPFSIQVTAPSAVTTGSASLTWTAPTKNVNGAPITDLAGYHIYYGTSASSLNESVTVSSPTETSYVIKDLAQGTYYFSVVAFNSMGVDSSESNTATKDIT